MSRAPAPDCGKGVTDTRIDFSRYDGSSALNGEVWTARYGDDPAVWSKTDRGPFRLFPHVEMGMRGSRPDHMTVNCGGHSLEVQDANARLLGDAPKLLATLRSMVMYFRSIEKIAGNQPDANLETRTGPNDAAMRGLWVVGARQLAQAALRELGQETEDFNAHD